MVKRVLMHVGLGKTASRTVQTTLARRRPALAQVGAVYPGDADAHHGLLAMVHPKGHRHGWCIGKGLDADAAQDLAFRHMSAIRAATATDVPVIILSSEHFQTLSAADLAQFDTQIAALGYQLETLCYIQAPLAHTASRVEQGVRQGSARIAQMMDRPYPPLARDFCEAALRALGSGRVHLRKMEDIGPSGLAADVLHVAGLTPQPGVMDDLPPAARLCHDAIYLLDAINARDALHTAERPLFRAHQPELLAMPGQPFTLPPDVARRIQIQSRPEQNWLFRHFKTCYPVQDLIDVPTHWQEIEWAADALAEVIRIDHAEPDWPPLLQAISA